MGWLKQRKCEHDWKIVAEYREPDVGAGVWIDYTDLYCPKCGKQLNKLNEAETDRQLNTSLENKKYREEHKELRDEIID